MEYIFIFVFGAIIGSFSNVVINRTINNESIVYPPSHCDKCGRKLKVLDLLPIVSFLSLRGRCRYCKEKIPKDNLLMELISGLLALLIIKPSDFILSTILFIGLIFALIIAIIDLKTYDIYMTHIGFLALLGGLYRSFTLGFNYEFFIYILVFILIYGIIYKVSKGGLGDGDIYYYLVLFLFVENGEIIWLTLISIWLGAIYGLIILMKYKNSKIALPFCIFIFLAFVLIILRKRLLL